MQLETRSQVLTGGEAVAHAMRQIDPDVVPVYPITPQTPIIQGFAKMVADGKASTEIVNVESEHSAMSAAVGSALAGARTITATSSQGLALMVEVIYIAAGMRAPIVMAVGNRALSAPINIHGDHSDAYLARDTGAIQILVESAQEAYDFMVMAPRIAEHPDVLLPVLVGQDGFTITHSAEVVRMLDDAQVQEFVGPYAIPHALLDLEHPTSQGLFAMPDYYTELRYQGVAAMEAALAVVDEVCAEFAELSGRSHAAVEGYRLEDAEVAARLHGLDRRHGQGRRRRAARGRPGRRAAAAALLPPLPRRADPRAARRRRAGSRCSTAPTRPAGSRRCTPRSPPRPTAWTPRSTATSTGSAAATCA